MRHQELKKAGLLTRFHHLSAFPENPVASVWINVLQKLTVAGTVLAFTKFPIK